MVMLYHLTLPPAAALDRAWAGVASFGWAGVDLFFVLSGFLITGILYDAKGGRHYFRNFYARRTLRIFPLYYAVMIVLLVIVPRLPFAHAARYAAAAGDQIWYWTYLSNFALGQRHEWNLGSLDLAWSLAIEEQFYLLWPAVVFLLGRRALMGFCVAVIVAALATRAALTLWGAHPIPIHVLTPCRMDSLALGALVALAARGPRGVAVLVPAARWCASVSLGLLIPLFLVQGPEWGVVQGGGQAVGYTILGLLFAAGLVLTISRPGQGLLGRTFAHPLLTTFGRYSYALYLFHLPLVVCLRETVLRPGSLPTFLGSCLLEQTVYYAAGISLTLAAAWLSGRFFEGPILSLKRFFPVERPGKEARIGPESESKKRKLTAGLPRRPFMANAVAKEKPEAPVAQPIEIAAE
jgi:peptidoglycan/LPS O-acetylase OafA/YrhL